MINNRKQYHAIRRPGVNTRIRYILVYLQQNNQRLGLIYLLRYTYTYLYYSLLYIPFTNSLFKLQRSSSSLSFYTISITVSYIYQLRFSKVYQYTDFIAQSLASSSPSRPSLISPTEPTRGVWSSKLKTTPEEARASSEAKRQMND